MTLKEWQEEINYFTAELTKLIRNLCFSGIAVAWMFKVTDKASIGFPRSLLIAFAFFFISLLFDIIFLGYSAYIANEKFNEKEVELNKDSTIDDQHKESYDVGGWNPCYVCKKKWLRRCKIISCMLGYITLGYYVWTKLL